jgi:methyl-accepting chemotaxis protein
MMTNWTFGRKLAATAVVNAIFLLVVGMAGYWALGALHGTSREVTQTYKLVEKTTEALSTMKDAETGQRGFLLTGDPAYLEPHESAVAAMPRVMTELRALTDDDVNQQRRVDQLEALVNSKLVELQRTIDMHKAGHHDDAIKEVQTNRGKSFMDDIRKVLGQMDQQAHVQLDRRAAEVDSTVNSTKAAIVACTVICLLLLAGAATYTSRSLTTQLGAAVGLVQSSSAELQAAATQQAAGTKQQASAMSEISTTISELGVTSRQIAESAQRVAQIAEQTATSSRSGTGTVERGQEAISGIRRQIDMVVSHMLDLGRKSQEIGAVLDIVSELAEQTNILAINATIEASGAGEAGKRFAVVAEEIRKLADRVSNSTKNIRTQVEDVRGAVNTTVMATETGAKAVDTGARQFTEVAQSFKQIAGMVITAAEAAREIELSTKQQATAAEQVRVAVTDVAQATQESETSSAQTLQTASQLATLSRDLQRMIVPV